MNSTPDVSIVIVSRDRPDYLKRVLVSLRYLAYPSFEVIVVSNCDPRALFPDIWNVGAIKYSFHDEANISAARNLGITLSAGKIVAFCDDDAVPEPSWLDHLIAPFSDKSVAASGGYVRGRNGISYQWKGRSFDRFGDHSELVLDSVSCQVFAGNKDRGIKTEGTNCAFRRQTLVEIGGFDENFHYYLDETDLNYRIGLAGWNTAIVPLAEVHHGYAANDHRVQSRAPRSLFEIGASKARFHVKHLGFMDLASFRAAQKRRLIGYMLSGALEPFSVRRLMADLDRGIAAGSTRDQQNATTLGMESLNPFQPFQQTLKDIPAVALTCRPSGIAKAAQVAKSMAQAGHSVTVFKLSLTSRFHSMTFLPDGYWLQTGGLFGRSARNEVLFRFSKLATRTKIELSRLNRVRPMDLLAPDEST